MGMDMLPMDQVGGMWVVSSLIWEVRVCVRVPFRIHLPTSSQPLSPTSFPSVT